MTDRLNCGFFNGTATPPISKHASHVRAYYAPYAVLIVHVTDSFAIIGRRSL